MQYYRRNLLITVVTIAALILTGCPALFTTSIFKDVFKPDIKDLPPDQLADYCTDVLANGTDKEKDAALIAVETAIAGGSEDPELHYMAAVLTIDQAGLNLENLMESVVDPASLLELFTPDNFIAVIEIGVYLGVADTGGVELSGAEVFFEGLGMLCETLTSFDDIQTVDFENPLPAQEAAVAFIIEGIANSDFLSSLMATLQAAP